MVLLPGFLAAVGSAVSFGSFAVPIKSPAVVKAKVHPLIFQSYKSLACFTVSWLLLLWADFRFTWWGIVAGLIWVHNGVMAIISIHLAGLGIAQSVWSGVSIAVSFAWGKAFFKEPTENVPLAVIGLTLMLLGMGGLGVIGNHFSTAELPPEAVIPYPDGISLQDGPESQAETKELHKINRQVVRGDEENVQIQRTSPTLETQSLVPHGTAASDSKMDADANAVSQWWKGHEFALGTLGAAWVGVCAGSMLLCLKLAPSDRQGDQYAMSFGVGVGLVTVVVLSIYFFSCYLLERKPPSFQARIAFGPGSLAGLLWTIGNYLSVIAVTNLGMAVGFPIVQCNLMIANFWALFYYKEIENKAILWFLISTLVIIAGVCLLAVFGL